VRFTLHTVASKFGYISLADDTVPYFSTDPATALIAMQFAFAKQSRA